MCKQSENSNKSGFGLTELVQLVVLVKICLHVMNEDMLAIDRKTNVKHLQIFSERDVPLLFVRSFVVLFD